MGQTISEMFAAKTCTCGNSHEWASTKHESKCLAGDILAEVEDRRSAESALETAEGEIKNLKEALDRIERLDRAGHDNEIASTMGYIARMTLRTWED